MSQHDSPLPRGHGPTGEEPPLAVLELPETQRPAGDAGSAGTGPAGVGRRSSALRRSLSVLGKRRRFLVDKRSQLRASLLTVSVVLVLLMLLNLSLYASRERSAAAILGDAPELASMIEAQNRLELILVAAASFVFLLGVFAVAVLETHKTAGAAFNLARHMDAIRAGQYGTRIHLRRGDNLTVLETAFNEMCRGLQERAWKDVEALEAMASECERLCGPDEAVQLAEAIRRHADGTRRLAE